VVYSFDIFDTVLTRGVAKPRDIFLLMQERLVVDSRFSSSKKIFETFSSMRVKAETGARQRTNRQDVTLSDIYDEFARLTQLRQMAPLLIQEEVLFEKSLLRPVKPVCEQIKALCRLGQRVIFISDMYFLPTILSGFLNDAGLSVSEGDIYVSGEIGLRKTTGGLFKYVLKREKIEPRELLHFGDNRISDVLIPKIMGIKVYDKF